MTNRGESAVEALQERLDELRRHMPEVASKRVACIEWVDPLMVELVGGQPMWGGKGENSKDISLHELVIGNPDLIVIMPCGFGIQRSLRELRALTAKPGWHELEAVKSEQVYLVDGNHYFNRPGPRVVDSVEILAEILHPRSFSFGHRGLNWIRLRRQN